MERRENREYGTRCQAMPFSFRLYLLRASLFFCVLSGCDDSATPLATPAATPSAQLYGSWATPVKEMSLTDIKQAYAVFTFRHDGKLEVYNFGSAIPTIPGDYANHMLITKDIGEFSVNGTTVSMSGVSGDSVPHTWTFAVNGNQLVRSEGGRPLATLTRVPFVSKFGATE